MKQQGALRLAAAAAAAGILAAPFAMPVRGLDMIVKLYMCQTEHELKSINAWETTDPPRYFAATKNRTVTPVDAAMDRAALMVSSDRITCDEDGRVAVDRNTEGPGAPPQMETLDGPALESYCPLTLKKHGHPCR